MALAGLALAAILPAQALQRVETIALGAPAVAAWSDAAGGKVFVATDAPSRSRGLAVLERNGRLTTIPLQSAPVALAGSSLQRKLLVAHAGGSVSIVQLDTLQASTVTLPPSVVVRALVAERTGRGYVLGRNGRDAAIASIDLKSQATRAVTIEDGLPVDFAVDAAGSRLFVLVARTDRTGEPPDSVLQVLDAMTLAPVESPLRLGRMPRAIAASLVTDDLFVLDHADPARPGDEAWRPTLRILDGALAPLRTVFLGDARASPLSGALQADATGTRAVVNDASAGRLFVVNPANGAVTTTQLESPAATVGLASPTGPIVAVMPQLGTAAVLSAGGERIDTVVVGHAVPADATQGSYFVVADAETGDSFVANGVEGTLVRLPRAASMAVMNLTDLWSDPAEPGWGVFVEHQGITIFAALFAYGSGGEAAWLMMPNGSRQPDGSFSGVLYRTQGPVPIRSSDVSPVGIMRIVPATDGSATLTYVTDGASTTRHIERFAMGDPPRACRWTTSLESASIARSNFTALWSNPADPGWGLAVSHRGPGLFAVLFTYDDDNRPAWMVMSRGRQVGPGAFSGELYRIGKGQVREVGALALRFSAVDEGVASWRMEGTEFRAPLLRQRFGPLVSRCGG